MNNKVDLVGRKFGKLTVIQVEELKKKIRRKK